MNDDDGDNIEEEGAASEPDPNPLAQEIQEEYKRRVKDAGGEGVDRKKVIEDVAQAFAEQEKAATEEVWRGFVDKVVESVDGRIRHRVHKDFEFILDALKDLDTTLLGRDDPMLSLPIPGVTKGTRVTILFAQIAALLRLVSERTRHAMEAAQAADRMAQTITALVELMTSRGALTIEDLLPDE